MARVIYYVCDVCGLLWDNCTDGKIRYNRRLRKHLCVDHYEYPRCSKCNCRIRPFNSTLRDYPGTKSKGTFDTCSTCYNKMVKDAKEEKPIRFDPNEFEKVKRLLRRTDNWDLATMIFGVVAGTETSATDTSWAGQEPSV